MVSKVGNNGEHGDATDREMVEGIAATLALPRGPVDAAAVARWHERLAAQGWGPLDVEEAGVTAATSHRHRFRHDATGWQVDVLVLPHDPADPSSVTVRDVPDKESQRYAFSTVRLVGPEGSGLLADANLTTAQADGTVTWMLSRPVGALQEPADEPAAHTAAANPFRRRFGPASGRAPALLRAPSLGLASGGIATVAMSLAMLGARRAGLVRELPPESMTTRLLDARGWRVSERTEQALAASLHVMFGGVTGALFEPLRRWLRLPVPATLQGVAYGLLVWVVSYMGWVPAVGLMPMAPRDQPRRPEVMIVAHGIYGAVLGALCGRAGKE